MEIQFRKAELSDKEQLKESVLELKNFEKQFEPNTLTDENSVEHLMHKFHMILLHLTTPLRK